MQAFYPEISAALSKGGSLHFGLWLHELRSNPEHHHLRPSGFRHGTLIPEPELAQLRHHHAVLHYLRGTRETSLVRGPWHLHVPQACEEAEMKDRSEFVPTELKALMKDQDLKHSPSAWVRTKT